MVNFDAFISSRTKYYGTFDSSSKNKEGIDPIINEKSVVETIPRMPKGMFKKALHHPNARAAPNYSVVEDLAQTPCTMYALEVLQRCPSQRNALLSALGSPLLSDDQMVKFDVSDVKPHLPYHVVFQIDVVHATKTIRRIVIDEGASTCVMALSCWQALGSPALAPSPTLLTTFDGRSFRPHEIIPSFDIT